jgi:hypothetical protein
MVRTNHLPSALTCQLCCSDSVAIMAGTERTFADFTLVGRVWGLYQPLFYGFLCLNAGARFVDATTARQSGAAIAYALWFVGTALYVVWMFRAVRATCVDGVLTIAQRRGKIGHCDVARVRRLEITSRSNAALVDDANETVLTLDWRLMTRGDLKRLATKLGVPYRTYTDVQIASLPPGDPLLAKPRR